MQPYWVRDRFKFLAEVEQKLGVHISDVLHVLTPREERVLRARFAIHCEMKTQAELGKELGISDTRIGQIHNKALRKLHRERSVSMYGE